MPAAAWASPTDLTGPEIVCEKLTVQEAPGFKSPVFWRELKLLWDFLGL